MLPPNGRGKVAPGLAIGIMAGLTFIGIFPPIDIGAGAFGTVTAAIILHSNL
jgi:hypothetical protein